ncbi:uncharacterized protein LOC141912097 [Tubulanus polymorphus]|uniref:uncharacterized protein LOC141912097 n=1 Tax=Tubulanus polymorphus TaxID=672921 RepID=UPI003DA47201
MDDRHHLTGRSLTEATRRRRRSIRAAAYSVIGLVLFISIAVVTYQSVFSFSADANLRSRRERSSGSNIKANAGILEMIVNGLLASYSTPAVPPGGKKGTPAPAGSKSAENNRIDSEHRGSKPNVDDVLNEILANIEQNQTITTAATQSAAETSPPTSSPTYWFHTTEPTTLPSTTSQPAFSTSPTLTSTAASSPVVGFQNSINGNLPNVTSSDCTKHDFVIDKLCVMPYQIVQMQMHNIQYMGLLQSVCDKTLCSFWTNCTEGKWCIPSQQMKVVAYNMAVRWTNGNYGAQVCPLQQCLRQVTQKTGCTSASRVYMVEATELMCDMAFAMKNEPDLVCAASAIYMMNMDLANLMRELPIEMKGLCDYPKMGKNVCKMNACRVYFGKMACLAQLCGSHWSALRMFPQWSWFFIYYNEIMRACEIPKSGCTESDIIEDPDVTRRKTAEEKEKKKKNFYIHYITAHFATDKRVVVGVILAGVVGCSAIIIIILALVRRVKRHRQYKRDFVDYSEVRGLVAHETT